MEKRGKPGLFLGVILPIALFEVLFILASILFFFFLKDNPQTAIAIVIIFGCIFFFVCLISITIYLLRYRLYEKAACPEGKLNALALIGFIMVAAGLLLNAFFSWIPLIGPIFSFFFALAIIAGGVLSIMAIVKFKQGEKGKGFANVGAFIAIDYTVHLIIVIILAIILFVVLASTSF